MRCTAAVATITFFAGLGAGLVLRSASSSSAATLARSGHSSSTESTGKSRTIETTASERQGIEQLHQQDIRATLSGDAHQLASLWDEEAVLMAPEAPTLVGKKAIEAELQKDKDENPENKPVDYKPEVVDLRIMTEGWAFEWGSFDARTQENPQKQPASFHGRFLRVLKKQSDGSWKFSRVMWNTPAKLASH